MLLRLCDASYDLPETLRQGTCLLQLLPTAPEIKQVRVGLLRVCGCATAPLYSLR